MRTKFVPLFLARRRLTNICSQSDRQIEHVLPDPQLLLTDPYPTDSSAGCGLGCPHSDEEYPSGRRRSKSECSQRTATATASTLAGRGHVRAGEAKALLRLGKQAPAGIVDVLLLVVVRREVARCE